MNTGKTLFAQLMDFLPWTTFTRIVDRYGGDHRVRTLSCAEQYRSMAFAQLTYRESLRDIETCLSVHASKLYHMGFRQPVRRSTLADANERRDWRIHAALAQRLITQARTLYVDEELGLDLTNTVYALDSTTIALCLSVFPWAHFRTTKAAVKMHTLLDLRGNIPSFIHISDGKLHDVHALDMLLPEAGAIYVVDRGYVDFARLYVLHQAGAFFVTRAKSNIDAHRVYSAPTRGFSFIDLDTGDVTPIANPDPDNPITRLNDGKCDRAGRYWSGTMDTTFTNPIGKLVRLDTDLSCSVMDEGFYVTNGIAWSPDNKTMYYSDSRGRTVYAYEFDIDSGDIANRREFISREGEEGRIDGATWTPTAAIGPRTSMPGRSRNTTRQASSCGRFPCPSVIPPCARSAALISTSST